MKLALRASCIAALIATAVPAHAAAAEPCDPATASAEAAAIRAQLDRDARNGRRWDIAWAVTFGVAAGVQVGAIAAEFTPLGDYDDDAEANLYIGAINSGLGAVTHALLPLDVVRPPDASGDACADLATAQLALRETARHEQQTFYLDHVGGLAVNAAGALILGFGYDAWTEGITSFALGYPVALLATYTQPRGAWHRARNSSETLTRTSWQLVPVRRPDYRGLSLVIQF
jgi:hypothetical protein